MRSIEFESLELARQLDLLYNDGVFIGKKVSVLETAVLYQLDDFYVEIHYIRYRRQVQWIHCFLTTEMLDPYLENMNVADLVV
jgi:hypothetical protein